MSADLAMQRQLRAQLVGAAAVTALVSAGSILDRHEFPLPDPVIILGDVVEVPAADAASGNRVVLLHSIHVWKQEPSFEGAKRIVAAIRGAIRGTRPQLEGDYHLAGWRVVSVRYLRDQEPDAVSSHAVMTVEAIVGGVAL